MRRFYFPVFLFSILAIGCNNNPKETTDGTSEQPAPDGPVQSSLGDGGTQRLMTVVADYYALKDALVATDAAKADEAANKLLASTDSLRTALAADSTGAASLGPLLDSVTDGSKSIVSVKDESTETKRIHFETVSNAMFSLVKQAQLKNAGIYRQYCPMAFNDKGAYWLSNEPEIRNPYFGKKMLECGEVTDSLR